MKLSGHTKPYAVFGHPIGHSLSPVMHNASFQELGLDAIYLAFDVSPDHLIKVLEGARDMGFGGINLTVPLKEVAFRGISDLDQSAKILGAVNTVRFMEDGSMVGYNTDGNGFMSAISDSFGRGVDGLSILVLGSGGAGRAVAITSAVNGASHMAITDVDNTRPQKVASEIKQYAPNTVVTVVDPSVESRKNAALKADLIIQATPIGMKPDDKPVLNADAFREEHMLFDLVYMYPETGIMKEARKSGAVTANGLGMLMHQGAYAFKIWTGQEAAKDVMMQALEKEVYPNAG